MRGGITHVRRIAQRAELYQVRTGSHGATDLSPVRMVTALHFCPRRGASLPWGGPAGG